MHMRMHHAGELVPGTRRVLPGCHPLQVSSYLPGIMSAPRLTTALQQRTMVDGGLWSVAPPDGQRHLSVSPFGGAFDVSPSSHTEQPARWPTVRVGMGWIDASPANLRAAWHAAHPLILTLSQTLTLSPTLTLTLSLSSTLTNPNPSILTLTRHAAHPVAELESLYRAGFDDAWRSVLMWRVASWWCRSPLPSDLASWWPTF